MNRFQMAQNSPDMVELNSEMDAIYSCRVLKEVKNL
jgi:hypothetical protein